MDEQPLYPQTESSISTPPLLSESTKTIFHIPSFVLGSMLTGLILAGFVILQTKSLPPLSQLPSPTSSFIPITTPTISTTTDWLTYAGDGYTLRYPTNFILEPYNEGLAEGIHLVYQGPNQTASGRTQTNSIDGISIKTLMLTKTTPLLEYATERRNQELASLVEPDATPQGATMGIAQLAPTTVGDRSAYTYTITGMGETRVYFVEIGMQTVLQIAVTIQGTSQQLAWYGTTVDLILSAISFSNQHITYTCPTTKYVDCMPGPGVKNPQCETAYMTWAEESCPGFKGGAY